MSDRKYTSALFECDIRSFKNNPHLFDTPFGRPIILQDGNVFELPFDDETVADTTVTESGAS